MLNLYHVFENLRISKGDRFCYYEFFWGGFLLIFQSKIFFAKVKEEIMDFFSLYQCKLFFTDRYV